MWPGLCQVLDNHLYQKDHAGLLASQSIAEEKPDCVGPPHKWGKDQHGNSRFMS